MTDYSFTQKLQQKVGRQVVRHIHILSSHGVCHAVCHAVCPGVCPGVCHGVCHGVCPVAENLEQATSHAAHTRILYRLRHAHSLQQHTHTTSPTLHSPLRLTCFPGRAPLTERSLSIMRSTGSVEPPPAASAPVPAGSVTTSSLMAPSAWEGGGNGARGQE